MREIKIEGFTSDTKPDVKPAVCVFGEANTGTTRFGTTLPTNGGMSGWIALDRNSKATVDEHRVKRGLPILINKEPFIGEKAAVEIAMNDDPKKVKAVYAEALKRVIDRLMALHDHKDVENIVIDRCSQLFDYILFSHFGRRNQIESFMRGAPNQDMIDIINALSKKNLCLICKATEIWKDTGEVDTQGKKKQAPSGKFKPDGFNQIDRFVTATIELSSGQKKYDMDPEDAYRAKYKCKLIRCKGNTLLEGQDLTDYGLAGEGITWENLMMVIGQEGE